MPKVSIFGLFYVSVNQHILKAYSRYNHAWKNRPVIDLRLNSYYRYQDVIPNRVALYDVVNFSYTHTLHITLFYKFLLGGNQVDGLPPDCNTAEGLSHKNRLPTKTGFRSRKFEILESLTLTFQTKWFPRNIRVWTSTLNRFEVCLKPLETT